MQNKLIKKYRQSREGCEDRRLTNSVAMVADMLFKLAIGYYSPEQQKGVWEMVEAVLRQYANLGGLDK